MILSALSLFSSCYYDVESELYPGSAVPDSCLVNTVTYVSHIKQITSTHCAIGSGCHGQGAPRVQLNNYNGVKSIADNGKMHLRVIEQKDMPPSGPLPPCELALIRKWLENGAPEN